MACATRFGYGEPLTKVERARLVELPLNARLEDVVGHINERVALEQQRLRLEPGILAQADGNLLYIDEVNLLDSAVTDAILDAAAQGAYTVRRGPSNFTYRARFLLIGSMNPEEGRLRPQLMDRFGLRAVARGLSPPRDRYQAYEQALWYRRDAEGLAAAYAEQTLALAAELEQARHLLPRVRVSAAAQEMGLRLIESLGIDSNRAEMTLFEAARAYAAAAERDEVLMEDVGAVALLALRLRQSPLLEAFFRAQAEEDAALAASAKAMTRGDQKVA
ncbi:MAG: ATP-binding protein [Anaerolineales bacterium]|nr:ATP-binding protein [Anaerolineales bacterium]